MYMYTRQKKKHCNWIFILMLYFFKNKIKFEKLDTESIEIVIFRLFLTVNLSFVVLLKNQFQSRCSQIY